MTLEPSPLRDIANRLDCWMRREAWPLWWRQGRHPNGAFFEALDFSGRALDGLESRVLVQARQLFSFMLADRLGWRTDGFAEALAASAGRFLDVCFRPDGLAGSRIDIKQGVLTDDRPDLYNNAFCLLALAQSRRVLGGRRADVLAGRLVNSIDKHFGRADGGCWESIPPPNRRLQNPHMHLFESLLVLYQHTGSADVRRRAESLLGFISEAFFDRRGNFVRESVTDGAQTAGGEGAPKPPTAPAGGGVDASHRLADDAYEPGHSMEWIWLLGCRARLFGVALHEFALPLYRHCCAALSGAVKPSPSLAAGARTDSAAEETNLRLGKTPMRLSADNTLIDPSCRLWAQAESLKAHLCILELGPPELTQTALQRARECAESIHGDWLGGAPPGGWIDQVAADGRRIAKTMPASTGYHLFVAIAELLRLADQPAKPPRASQPMTTRAGKFHG